MSLFILKECYNLSFKILKQKKNLVLGWYKRTW